MRMSREEALELHKELREMVWEHPYPIPGAKDRLRKIEFAFNCCTDVTAYFREKVSSAIHWVGIWCTERKWRQWGDDPSRLRGIVLNNISATEMVIEQELPTSVEPAKKA